MVKSDGFKVRYGQLVAGLRLNQRVALLYPVLFMVRRLAYVSIIIYWLDKSCLQVLSILVTTCFFGFMYLGYFKPYDTSY